MKGFKQIALTIGAIAAASVLTSAMAVAPLPEGWYIEVNGGDSRITNADYASQASLSSSGLGWNANAGYKFMPFFAAEIGYTKYASSSAKVGNVKVAKATNNSYDLAGKGLLPIGDTGAELFAKLGVVRINTSVSAENSIYAPFVDTGNSHTTGYYFGLGADYSFLPNLSVNGQWQRAKGNSTTGNLDLFSLGLGYLFG